MLMKRYHVSIKRLLALAFIFLIGLNAVDSQSRPQIFEIKNISAFTDKGEYLKNDIINITYILNCSGKTGDKSFIFKANESFSLNETPKYKPNVIYPMRIGSQSEKPYCYSTPDGFRRYYVPLFDNNNESKSYLTKITLNISPTLKCRLNRTFDLTDRSFVDIRPNGDRISSQIRIINKNPEIINPIIKKNTIIAQFTVKDKDSLHVDWSLCKNGKNISGSNGSISMQEDPLNENIINISKFYPELASLRLHLWDSDGGENWSSSLNNWAMEKPIVPQGETIYRNFSIFILVVIALSFLSFNYFSLGLRSKLLLYGVIIIFHYFLFELDFIFLLVLLLVASSASNYLLRLLSEHDSADNLTIKKMDVQKREFLTKWSLISNSWIVLITLITIHISSRNIVDKEINYLAIMGVCITFLSILLAIFATDKIANLKKYAKRFELAVVFYCILWIVFFVIIIHGTYVKSFSNAYLENSLIILYLTFFSLNLLPALIYFYFAPEQ